MYYSCDKFIPSYIDSFNRNKRNTENKKGLVLPKMEDIESLENEVFALFFPGLSGGETRSKLISIISYHMENVTRLLADSVFLALSYEDKGESTSSALEEKTVKIVDNVASKLKDIRADLKLDAESGFNGDPASKSIHEIILSYPSMIALSAYRVAHELYELSVPLIPRMMSEIVHRKTGIDIHPGAKIGKSFFIDHGTGVVIGETAVIGDNVKIYQGVTLGALSFKKDSCGALIKGIKRHPTIEDNVTIYSNTSILGDVRIGHNSIIGTSVRITTDIPAYSLVTAPRPDIRIRDIRENKTR